MTIESLEIIFEVWARILSHVLLFQLVLQMAAWVNMVCLMGFFILFFHLLVQVQYKR
jgi:hypothetical protein